MKKSFLFTSESVAEGHPDRVCDTISDAIVDRFLHQDPYSHIVTECALSKGIVFIAARFASKATVDLPEIARQVVGRSVIARRISTPPIAPWSPASPPSPWINAMSGTSGS